MGNLVHLPTIDAGQPVGLVSLLGAVAPGSRTMSHYHSKCDGMRYQLHLQATYYRRGRGCFFLNTGDLRHISSSSPCTTNTSSSAAPPAVWALRLGAWQQEHSWVPVKQVYLTEAAPLHVSSLRMSRCNVL
jgi:hypothetical protein